MANNNNPYTSTELYHFVGRSSPEDHETNYKTLLKILEYGCISHPPHDGSSGSVAFIKDRSKPLLTEELVVPTVTCYADIPFESLSIHVEKYGCFGFSLQRNFLSDNGARPVMYVPISNDDWKGIHGASLLKEIESVYRGFSKEVVEKLSSGSASYSRKYTEEPRSSEEAIHCFDSIFVKDFLAFIKPFCHNLNENDPNNFYMEREWRKFGNMNFELTDIKRIIVKEGFHDRLKKDLPDFNGKIKVIPPLQR